MPENNEPKLESPNDSEPIKTGKKGINKGHLIAIILIVGITLFFVARHKLGPYHFKTVKDDVLYRCGSLRPYNLEYVAKKYGIKSIVSMRLQTEGDWEVNWYENEKNFCKENNLNFYHIPIKGKDLPTEADVKKWFEIMDDPANHPVLLHCEQGVVRTGVMVALYEIKYNGKSPKAAWDELPTFRHDFDKKSMMPLKEFVYSFKLEDYDEH